MRDRGRKATQAAPIGRVRELRRRACCWRRRLMGPRQPDGHLPLCLRRPTASAVGDLSPSRVDINLPGASLGREYERRRFNHEQRVREAHPHIGGLLLALNGEPQHTSAFRAGEQGEIAVAATIENAVEKVDGFVLHNRRMPSGRGDIDHIAITVSGVYVVDAKAATGRVEVRRRWSKPPQLFIGGRDRTKYLDGLDRQIQTVHDTLQACDLGSVPIQAALCFTRADLPLLRTVEVRGHLLVYPKALAKRLTTSGPLTHEQCASAAATLAAALRPA